MQFVEAKMADFWDTPHGRQLMSDGTKRLRQAAATFCTPFEDNQLPPYVCTSDTYSSAIGAAWGLVHMAFSAIMSGAPYLVAWLVARGCMLRDNGDHADEWKELKVRLSSSEGGYMPASGL